MDNLYEAAKEYVWMEQRCRHLGFSEQEIKKRMDQAFTNLEKQVRLYAERKRITHE